jgi:hypothetical protein
MHISILPLNVKVVNKIWITFSNFLSVYAAAYASFPLLIFKRLVFVISGSSQSRRQKTGSES